MVEVERKHTPGDARFADANLVRPDNGVMVEVKRQYATGNIRYADTHLFRPDNGVMVVVKRHQIARRVAYERIMKDKIAFRLGKMQFC
jgi:S-adenosylmethionine hydrolase